MRFQFLDVGMGDGTLVQISQASKPGDILVLVDFGEARSSFKAGYKDAMLYLVDTINANSKKRGLDDPFIDYLFITHGDRDHYNKIEELSKQKFPDFPGKRLRFGDLYYSGVQSEYEGLIGRLRTYVDVPVDDMDSKTHAAVDAKTKTVKPSFSLGDGVKVYILSSNFPTRTSAATNPKSIVLMFELGAKKVILQGDAEGAVEDFIITTFGVVPGFLETWGLKLGHHGSKNGTTEEWLQATKPKVVFASGDVVWAHPYCETICRVLDNKSLVTLADFIWYSCGSGAKEKRQYYNNRTNLGVCLNLWYVVPKLSEKLRTTEVVPKDVIGFLGNSWGVQWELAIEANGSWGLKVTDAASPIDLSSVEPGWDCSAMDTAASFREIAGHGPPNPLEFIP